MNLGLKSLGLETSRISKLKVLSVGLRVFPEVLRVFQVYDLRVKDILIGFRH